MERSTTNAKSLRNHTSGPTGVKGPRSKRSAIKRKRAHHPRNAQDRSSAQRLRSPDFRGVYAALLEDWLKTPSSKVLGGTFAKAKIITA